MKKLTKKMLICIMALVVFFSVIPMNSFAADPTIIESGKCGDNVTYTLDSDGLLTISGIGEMENYQYSGDSPFYYNSSIKSIVINKGVTSIGEYAFCVCTGLTSITIPDSVTSIGELAFCDCAGLTSIIIPDSVTSISNYAFRGCTGLTSITIPNSITSISYGAFEYCTGLTSITIPDSVTSIDKLAFCDCAGLTSIAIPNSVTNIGEYAFYGCTGLTNITVDENNKEYDSRNNCNAIIETKTNTLIFGCKNTVIPDGVTSISNYAFNGCTGLTSVTIPNSVTSIGSAFCDCAGLTSIAIPNSVTNIGEYAFYGCTGLTNITVDENNKVYDSRNNCNAIIETETNELIFGCKNTVIPDSVKNIGDNAFDGCTGLTSIAIPNSVTSIGELAFCDCTGLTNITIPNSVTSIGERAFYGCTGLTSITIPNSITSISYGAFEYCTGLTSITIPDSVTSIGELAFYGCTGLTSVTIPNSVTSIGEYAFSGCTSLTSITIPNSVTNIGEYAFYECSNLKDVYYMGTEEQWKQINIGDGNKRLTNATIHYIQPTQAESNVTVDSKSYSVVLDYGTALDGNVKLNISKADSGDFNIPLNPFLFVNINATSNGKTVQPQKPVTLMFEKAMFNCEIADLSIYHFPDGKTKEIFNNGNPDSDYHITVKTLNGKTYYCITVSSLSPFVFADSTGDVNSDGKINSSDALLVLQHTVKNITLTEKQQKLADVNKDTFVNSNDALWILEYAVGKRNTF